jgi:hypothetical protein
MALLKPNDYFYIFRALIISSNFPVDKIDLEINDFN